MLTVVANRLPVERIDGNWSVSPGGLVAALQPVLAERGGAWVGWPGDTEGDQALPAEVEGLRLHAVPLSKDEHAGYYAGFSNATLWPLYHDNVRPPEFHRRWWHTYQAVNQRFAAAAAAVAPDGGAVWVHDYHLSLVPAMLRALRPDLRIGFFLHIPFPPMELFAQLPWRSAMLEGMLGADAIGFQTVYGARNFRAVARRWAATRTRRNQVLLADRTVRAEAHPISIDSARFSAMAASEPIRRRRRELREQLSGRRILLGVDRLDYTKGIEIRLRAFENLLDRQPELAEQVVFVQVAVPSREGVGGYAAMREEIEHLTGRINGKHARLGLQPVNYRYGGVNRQDLVAIYAAADAMIVTPLRDGMNLVAKEYVACQTQADGYLVLSEFTGAAHELHQADLVNPYDLDGITDALARAIAAPTRERRRRMQAMRRQVLRHDVHRWAHAALEAFAPDA